MKGKWFWVGIVIIGTTSLLLSRFYVAVQTPHWQELNAAAAQAGEKAHVTNITDKETFYGDEPMDVVSGDNEKGEKVIVWMSEKGVHTELASAGITKEDAKRILLGKHSDAHILRISPGKIQDQYVWEVFYSLLTNTGTQYFYDYYKFSDGSPVDTYRLSLN